MGTAIDLASGDSPFLIAITPSGASAYVTNLNSDTVTPISLPSGTVGTDITVGTGPAGIAITPNGATAYVANFDGGSGSTVTPITLATNTAGSPITVGTGPYAVAVTPDGTTAYATSGAGDTVVPITMATNTAGTAISVGSDPRGIGITPDQAPVASFNVTPAPPGSATSFDASASTIAFGTIGSYLWNFGDGSATVTTTTPTTTHTYTTANTYTASVTETSSAGTSTSGEVYTGQTASSVGNASAETTRSVVITSGAAPAVSLNPTNFDFETVAVGATSSAQPITLTNTGTATLNVGTASLSGPQATDFSITSDGCSGQPVAANGGTCVVDVAFAPAMSGAASAQLNFPDNASGSPQSVGLSGTGHNEGSVSGSILDGTQPSTPPVSAIVLICENGTRNCDSTSTNSSGAYSFAGLSPGSCALRSIRARRTSMRARRS